MSFNYELSTTLKKVLNKLIKKDKGLAIAINRKIKQIIELDNLSINHFENLRAPMNHLKRVHIQSFVLIFQIKNNTIFFENFKHHDEAY